MNRADGDPSRRRPLHLLTAEELKEFSRTSSARFMLAVLIEMATIALAIGICQAHWNPGLYALVVLVIGARMHGLAILMHETAHRHGCWPRWNDAVGEGLALTLPFSMHAFRESHLAHHRDTNGAGDPNLRRYLTYGTYDFPMKPLRLLVCLARYATGYQSIQILRKAPAGNRPDPVGLRMLRIACPLALLAFALHLGFWKGCLLYGVVPFVTSLALFSYVRSVAEHFPIVTGDSELTQSRTVLAPAWERWLFAPHGINFHVEHHLYPSVPFHRLADLHAFLMKKPEYAAQARVTHGYLRGLLRECFGPAWVSPTRTT